MFFGGKIISAQARLGIARGAAGSLVSIGTAQSCVMSARPAMAEGLDGSISIVGSSVHWRFSCRPQHVFNRPESGHTSSSDHTEPARGAICKSHLWRGISLCEQRLGRTKGLNLPQDPSDPSAELPSFVTVDGKVALFIDLERR